MSLKRVLHIPRSARSQWQWHRKSHTSLRICRAFTQASDLREKNTPECVATVLVITHSFFFSRLRLYALT